MIQVVIHKVPRLLESKCKNLKIFKQLLPSNKNILSEVIKLLKRIL